MKLIAPILLAAGLALGGCGNKVEKTITSEDGTKTTVTARQDGDNAVMTTQSEDGSTSTFSTGGQAWPKSAPEFAAAYPGARIESSFSGTADGKSGGMATFKTTDSPDKVVGFYKERAKAAGLTRESNMEANGARIYGATDDSGRSVSVQTGSEGGETTAAVTFSAKAS